MLALVPTAIASVAVLRHINLDSNRLTHFPVELASLPSLHWLSLRWNAIEALPDAIGACGSLRHLDCSFNQITSVSDRIGACKSLETLLLHDNSLIALPESMGELSGSLKELNVDFNQLSRLPNSIARLFAPRGHLQALHVRGNPLVSPPPEIVLDGFAALVAFYVRLVNYHVHVLFFQCFFRIRLKFLNASRASAPFLHPTVQERPVDCCNHQLISFTRRFGSTTSVVIIAATFTIGQCAACACDANFDAFPVAGRRSTASGRPSRGSHAAPSCSDPSYISIEYHCIIVVPCRTSSGIIPCETPVRGRCALSHCCCDSRSRCLFFSAAFCSERSAATDLQQRFRIRTLPRC